VVRRFLAVLGSLFLSFPAVFASTAFQFAAPTRYAGGNGTAAIAAGDVNGDGFIDIVALNRTDNNIAVLLNDGTGKFLPVVTTALPAMGLAIPMAVGIGDFNGDHKLDVVVVEGQVGSDGAKAVVLPGNGNGTFGTPVLSPTGNSPWNVSVGDLNGDGKLDLFVGGNGSGAVLLGNGDGTFRVLSLPLVSSPAISQPGQRAMGIADLNGDGRMDLVAACEAPYGVCVWTQDQAGTLGTGAFYATCPQQTLAAYSIASADMNKDGRMDVVIGQYSFNGVSLLLGNGDGTLQPVACPSPFIWYGGSSPSALAIGDFNRDGGLDVAASDYNAPSSAPNDGYGVTIAAGNGDGAMGRGTSSLVQLDAGAQAGGIVAADFNGDGSLDIATANSNTGTVDVLMNSVTTSVTVPATGWWWDPKLSGIGFFIEEGGKSGTGLFVGGFMYDAAGKSTWAVSTGPMTGQTYNSTWLRASGGQTLLGPYKTPGVNSTASLNISFSDPSHAVMTRPDGTQINLQRFSFTGSTPTAPMGGAPQSGWWWAGSSLSGTGYGIEIQGGSVFIVAYVYDDSGNPIWYLATGALTTSKSYSGSWDLYAAGPQLTSPEGTYAAQKIDGASVPMSLTFTDTTHGTLSMGNVTIPIVRFQEF
jgi:hypothetical protein